MEHLSVRVMVVEDEPDVRDEYRRMIKERSMMQLVAETDNQEEALKILEMTSVDAIILDLELPRGSGILLLEKIQMLSIEKPFIAVVTNVVSKVIYDTIRSMGVDYICAKGDENFSLDVPLSIIEISAPFQRTKEVRKNEKNEMNARTRKNIYQRNIEFELSRMGFPTKLHGTIYCEEAIVFVAMSERQDISMTKEVYPYIAEKYETNAKNVERNIRIVIEKVWTEQDVRKLKELYPYEWNVRTGRPTNAEFFYNIVQKIIRR